MKKISQSITLLQQKMKTLVLSDVNASHTLKWVSELKKDMNLELFTLSTPKQSLCRTIKDVPIFAESFSDKYFVKDETYLKKIFYLKSYFKIKRLIRKSKPDILHAHYASSYGLLGALTGFHPFIVSVWGSDVFDFPRKSFLHKVVLKYVFRKADKILSTSYVMAKEIKLYSNKEIAVTPFGVDTGKFQPTSYQKIFSDESIVIGTIKTLEKKYGIEYLLKSFSIVKYRHPVLPLKLLIVGGGTEEQNLKDLAVKLRIENDTFFAGKIHPDEVNQFHSQLAIAVFPSIYESESFGVAVLESSASGVPVIASNVGGLPEVVKDGITGILVPRADEVALAEAIEKLILNEDLRRKMGRAGREYVIQNYELKSTVEIMKEQYCKILNLDTSNG